MILQNQLILALAEADIFYSIDILSQSSLMILWLFRKRLVQIIVNLSWIQIIILLVNYSAKWCIWLCLDWLSMYNIHVINWKHTIFTEITEFTMMIVTLLNLNITRLILLWISKILNSIYLFFFTTFGSTRSLEWRWRRKSIRCLIIIRKSCTHRVFLLLLICF